MIRVFLPSQLDDYTDSVRELELDMREEAGKSLVLADVIAELERRYKGLAFRIVDEHGNIRRHIAMFVGETMVRTLDVPVTENSRVQIVGALSGG
ncbi:MAG: MoaD/ThiS family protein [Gammaproteobacteria bacterium]|nr:MoaD/ThiS family protein [Gammaproteobacteria bacterium]MDP2346943.1 MoaD/ThiS family protein [Gammaproteobacteria bacterium]